MTQTTTAARRRTPAGTTGKSASTRKSSKSNANALNPKTSAADAPLQIAQPEQASIHGTALSSNTRSGLLGDLGLIGLGGIEPMVLAALATETPLLLIGVHGSAKSLLLERLALALGLHWRHYNAALVNYDDLIGYPLPDANGNLRFIPTPASIWEAEAVFVDEISRARIDMQNRLFPIIHERRVQGMPLARLRHRWAAMNPPTPRDEEPDASAYLGSESLDLALADRFAWHIPMPDWHSFDEVQQERVIRARPEAGQPDGSALRRCLEETRGLLPSVQVRWSEAVSRYVRVVCGLLQQAGVVLSARRAGQLLRNVLSVHAVRLVLPVGLDGADAGADGSGVKDTNAAMADSAWLALSHSLPMRACGQNVPASALLAAHREAWRLACVEPGSPLLAILTATDPIRRVKLALRCEELDEGELTTLIVDAMSALPPGASHALAEWLLESPHARGLSVLAADECGQRYRSLIALDPLDIATRSGTAQWKLWKALEPRLARLDPSLTSDARLANLLIHLFKSETLKSADEADAVIEAYRHTRERLTGEKA